MYPQLTQTYYQLLFRQFKIMLVTVNVMKMATVIERTAEFGNYSRQFVFVFRLIRP